MQSVMRAYIAMAHTIVSDRNRKAIRPISVHYLYNICTPFTLSLV
jgi:hypothetical protein